MSRNPLYDYSRWEHRRRRREQLLERAGYVLVGIALALIMYAFIVILTVVAS